MIDKVKVTVYLDKELWKEVRKQAIDEDQEYSAFVERILIAYFKRGEK